MNRINHFFRKLLINEDNLGEVIGKFLSKDSPGRCLEIINESSLMEGACASRFGHISLTGYGRDFRKLQRSGVSDQAVLGKYESLPFADRTFDYVIEAEMFTTEFSDFGRVIREVRRILTPSGVFMCFEPARLLVSSLVDAWSNAFQMDSAQRNTVERAIECIEKGKDMLNSGSYKAGVKLPYLLNICGFSNLKVMHFDSFLFAYPPYRTVKETKIVDILKEEVLMTWAEFNRENFFFGDGEEVLWSEFTDVCGDIDRALSSYCAGKKIAISIPASFIAVIASGEQG